ncbi:MAG TPA: YggT family protein [Ktedonobacterales bacterium]|nr:YggT family protein [Ktedonobacterales bacterium]
MSSVQSTQPVQPVELVQTHQPSQLVESFHPVQSYRPVHAVAGPRPMSPTYRASQIVYLVLGIIETLLILRVILKLLAANPSAGFTSFLYGVTGPLVAPFQGLFPSPATSRSVLELSTLVGIVVYALVAWAIGRLISILRRNQPPITA